MRNIQYLTIDINKKTQQDVTANEGEIGSRFLKIKITDNNVPVDLTGTKVYLYALKSDNTKLFNLVEIVDATQGVVLGELTSQLLTSPGVVKLTLVLTEGTKKLISKEFSLKVDDSIFDDDAIESTNEFTALTRSLNKVDEWDGYFEETSGQIEQKYTERLNGHDAQFISKANIDIDATMLKMLFGAKGDGITDDTIAIQRALNYIKENFTYGSLELNKNSIYKITDTILVPSTVSIRGAYGGKEEAKPVITWYGASGKNMIEIGDSSSSDNLHENPFKNFSLRGKGRNANFYAKNGIVIKQRCDLGSYLQDVSLHLFEDYGVIYEKGGLNVHCKNFRIDSIGKKAIKWCVGGVDYLSIDGFTCDGNRIDLNKSGGVLEVDISNNVNDLKLNLSVSNSKLEVNSPMDNNELFLFNIDKSRQIFHNITFNNVFVTNLNDYRGVVFSPTSYDSRLTLINSRINITGISGYKKKVLGDFHSLTVINPNSISNALSNATDRNMIDLYCDVDIDNLYSKGNKVSNIIQTNFNPSTPITYKKGDWLIDSTMYNSLVRYVKEVVTDGTIGTTMATGSLTVGSSKLIVNSLADFKIGDYITISTYQRRIIDINYNTNTLILSSSIPASLTNELISFTPPTYVEHQLLTKRHWYPTQASHGSFKKGDIIFNTDIGVGKYAGWICSADGSPGTWLGFGKLETPV